jgi:hypothetical protein
LHDHPIAPPPPPYPGRPARFARLGAAALLLALCGPAWAGKTPLALSPATVTVGAGGHVSFQASGGTGGYEYALTVNNSGGSIDAGTGDYTAGSVAGADTVTVTDSSGTSSTAKVQVQAKMQAAPDTGTTDLGGHR